MKILAQSLVFFTLILTGTQALAHDEHTEVTVRSAGNEYTPSGPAPEFASLDADGNGNIDRNEAKGYTLLANDFLKADSNEDGSLSKSEYEHWAAAP